MEPHIDKPFVDFMIIGAMKCGTTTLADILKSHPQVCFAKTKEPQFFSESSDWRKELANYRKLFSPEPGQITGEGSTGYTMFPEFNKSVAGDIYQFNPRMKFIYMMRDPVARITSHYIHSYLRGYTRKSFDDAIVSQPEFISRTRYHMQIKPFIDHFGRGNVLLITMEEFLANKNVVLGEIATFLDIRNDFPQADLHSNQAPDDIDIMQHRKLRRFYRNKMLGKILNKLYKTSFKATVPRVEVSAEHEGFIWQMTGTDIAMIETLMKRQLNEWPTVRKFRSIYNNYEEL